MKKPKISLDSAKLKGLLFRHVEKLLLIVVVGMMLFLVYQGFSMPGLETGKTPQGLLETSQSMLQFINDNGRWNQIREKREITDDVVGGVHTALLDIDPNQYFLPNTLDKPNFPKLSPRTDPKLFAPVYLVVRPIIGPLAYLKAERYVDPLQPVPTEDDEEVIPKKKAKPKAKPKANRGPPAVAGMDPMGTAGSTPPGVGRKGSRRGSSDDLLGGDQPPSIVGDGMGMGMGMDLASSSPGMINPEAIRGYQANDAEAHNTQAVVVMAVVPYEKQFEEFQKALLNSLDYQGQRDTPTYLQYYVQRVDVTDNPEADPATLDWEKDPVSVKAALEETYNWVGFPSEIVDLNYVDKKLTHPAPPFMQRDLWDLLTHPEVPLPVLASTDVGSTDIRRPRPKPTKGGTDSDAPTIDDFLPGSGAGTNDGMSGGMPAMPGGAVMPRGGGGPPGIGPPGVNRPSGVPSAVGPGGAGRSGSSMPPGIVGSGMPGMAGDGMDSGSLAGLPPPKYKLIRFTDVNVEAGHKYRYRVKVLLHDPNHPAPGYTPPSLASLHQEVRDRIRGLDASVFYVASDWSEASPVAEMPSVDRYFAGSVKQPATSNLIPGKPEVPATTHPVGKSLVVVWDGTKAVDVGAEVDIHRGSILNFIKESVSVVHPVSHTKVVLKDYAFSTGAVVADMIGGQEIPLINRQSEVPELIAPGEMLIIDSQGKLRVQDETEDIEGFRRFLITDPPPQVESGSSDPMGDAGSFGGILDGLPPMPAGGRGPPGIRGGSRPPQP